MALDFPHLAQAHLAAVDAPGFPLTPDFPQEEYLLRVARARAELRKAGLDALVITSSAVGHWFTNALEPHEWHDQCSARSAWYILTDRDDLLLMTATAGGEHFNTTRRSTWVSRIGAIVERAEAPRWETWDIGQIPPILAELGLARGRLGFELGDCMTLGLSVNDFLRLRGLMPHAQFEDASPVIRRLMSLHTALEIEWLRTACMAGTEVHDMVPEVLRAGMTERSVLELLAGRVAGRFPAPDYTYQPAGGWDVRNLEAGDSNPFHSEVTSRMFKAGDLLSRSRSGIAYRRYGGDVDRMWSIGAPSQAVLEWYAITWECNRAMAAAIRPGVTCAEIYQRGQAVERRHPIPARPGGRTGHGYRNAGGLSVHPDNPTVLEPSMIISVEPMFANEHGYFDLEDQYLITENGAEALHPLAPETLPVIDG